MKYDWKILLEKLVVGIILGLVIAVVLPTLPTSIAVTGTTQLTALFSTILMSVITDIQGFFHLKQKINDGDITVNKEDKDGDK